MIALFHKRNVGNFNVERREFFIVLVYIYKSACLPAQWSVAGFLYLEFCVI